VGKILITSLVKGRGTSEGGGGIQCIKIKILGILFMR
jgi:hypothetical protein